MAHEFHHSDDFGLRFVINEQLAEAMVAADLGHNVLCRSTRFTAPDEANHCGKTFIPSVIRTGKVTDQVCKGEGAFQVGVTHDSLSNFDNEPSAPSALLDRWPSAALP
jgi:hypothetical protein